MSSLHIEFAVILLSLNIVLVFLIAYIVRQTIQIKKVYQEKIEERNRNDDYWIQKKNSFGSQQTIARIAELNKNNTLGNGNKKKLSTFLPPTPNSVGASIDVKQEMEELYAEVPLPEPPTTELIYDIPPPISEPDYCVPPEIGALPLPGKPVKKLFQ